MLSLASVWQRQRKAPNMIAAEICGKIDGGEMFSKIEPVAAYINFFTNKSMYAKTVIEKVAAEGESYGMTDEGCGKTVRYRLFFT